MNGIFELLTNRHWMISRDYLQAVLPVIQHNLTAHAGLAIPEKVMGYPVSADGTGRILADNGRYDRVKEPFINLEFVDGPITRNGDACSYGSVHHRDMMMAAADSPYCVGHIFHINTPGGSAWAKNDYQQAIGYARSKGQRVIAFIDGMCCSAGMYLAALCDERYYMHPKDQIGCIGVMAAFFTMADGSKNEFTDETWHEVYDPESFDKNAEIRDIANDGNTEKLIAELKAMGAEFRADVKEACPKAKDEHLHGRVFDARDVEGILVDGQKTLAGVIALFGKEAKAVAQRTSTAAAAANGTILSTHNNITIDMKEKFPKIFAHLGVEAMECMEDGAFFNTRILETLEAGIGEMEQAKAEAEARAAQLTADMEQLQNQLTEKDADHQSAIESLTQEHAAAIAAKDAEIEAKNLEIATLAENEKKALADLADKDAQATALAAGAEEMKAALAAATQSVAERDQQISDLNARIAELEAEPGNEGSQAGQASNGEGAGVPSVGIGLSYVYDPSLSYEANMAAKKAWEESHRG